MIHFYMNFIVDFVRSLFLVVKSTRNLPAQRLLHFRSIDANMGGFIEAECHHQPKQDACPTPYKVQFPDDIYFFVYLILLKTLSGTN